MFMVKYGIRASKRTQSGKCSPCLLLRLAETMAGLTICVVIGLSGQLATRGIKIVSAACHPYVDEEHGFLRPDGYLVTARVRNLENTFKVISLQPRVYFIPRYQQPLSSHSSPQEIDRIVLTLEPHGEAEGQIRLFDSVDTNDSCEVKMSFGQQTRFSVKPTQDVLNKEAARLSSHDLGIHRIKL